MCSTRPAHTVVEGCLSSAWQERLAFVIAQVEVIGKFLYGFSQGMFFSIGGEAKQGKHHRLVVGNRHCSQPHRSSSADINPRYSIAGFRTTLESRK